MYAKIMAVALIGAAVAACAGDPNTGTGPRENTGTLVGALAGAAFLVLCDLAARTIHPPVEIRLGVVTALCGGPVFIALLMRRHREAGRL